MTSNQILFGLGLVLVLAVGSQLVARVLKIPGLVVLLPVGFVAGIATADIHPDNLLGPLYQPLVSIAVGVILFEAGLRLSLGEVPSAARKVLARLVVGGTAVTWLAITATVALLYADVDRGVAFLVGAILVVSGPTVVLPLLAFIRPAASVRALLKWEGTLVDPIGALLGVVVFQAIRSGEGWRPGAFSVDLAVGVLVAGAAAPLMMLLLREVHRTAPRMTVPATLMAVVAVVVAADLIRDDTGLLAAVLLGMVVANQRSIDVSRSLFEFEETLVQLLIGVLFVLVAASVSPDQVRSVMPEALVLVAIMILLVRPLAVALTTLRSSFTIRERSFIAWMDPRGIVAGATASAFGPELAQRGVAGADKLLPIVFVAIFGTVLVYGLTAPWVARSLGVAGKGRSLMLIVGGHQWAREIGGALRQAGVAVRMWVGPVEQQTAARDAGLDADRGRIMVDAINREAELEEVTCALLVTPSDDFNTLAAAELRNELGHRHVFRIAPHPAEPNLLPPAREAGILADRSLTFAKLEGEYAAGARIVSMTAEELMRRGGRATDVLLIAVTPAGQLTVTADGQVPDLRPADTAIVLLRSGENGRPG